MNVPINAGDFTDTYSTSIKFSNPFSSDQNMCMVSKPRRLSKSKRRSSMSVFKEERFELHNSGYFRSCPPHRGRVGIRLNRTNTDNKLTIDSQISSPASTAGHTRPTIQVVNDRNGPSSTAGHTRPTIEDINDRNGPSSTAGHTRPTIQVVNDRNGPSSTAAHTRPTIEDIDDRNGPSLESLGIFERDLDITTICAPPKKSIYDALYQRVASFLNPDISVVIGSCEFLCHKIVLQCYSEYFEELKDHSEVVVEGITKGAFIAIYNWMLAPGMEGLRYIQKNNILEVLVAAKVLKVKELENQCLSLIDSKEAFSEENAYLLFIDASKRRETEIMELMVPRIQIFFLVLVSTAEFTELGVDDLCTILRSNYVVVHCELEIFMSAVKWLMAKWTERAAFLAIVMRCIRFGLMTPAQLVDIRKNPMSPEFIEITKDKTVQMLIEDGLAYSVESRLARETDLHARRCELLKLEIPEPRNWTRSSKAYKSYEDFLDYLNEISKDPQLFLADVKKDAANSSWTIPAHAEHYSSSSSDESCNGKNQLCRNPADVTINQGSKTDFYRLLQLHLPLKI